MNCARAGVENHNGREIRTTSGTQNDHVLPPSSSHHHSSLLKKKKSKKENNVMEKGKKEKKHGATGKVEQEVGTNNGTTCPLKRAAVPGDHLTIEHPEFSWSARSTQIRKNENNVMEKGKKEKKHGATGKVEQEVGTKY
ncbi:hypothetical protein F2Q69_00046809 [Brassica cretica]|uniref:Uncharacterized protein n=1 Tax=Brassica cretica TaxID=69181 RepID=A0A8S9Q467_BRACR|nr:hypothetical protein F2Q69_00046809 [Brassica cretica]